MADDLFPDRLAALERELRTDEGECPFVLEEVAAEGTAVRHFSGGRDATYVLVSRAAGTATQVTIKYAPFVEGTTIIYDATGETMQGKARPFVCDLTKGAKRVYALLPQQIETIALRTERVDEGVKLRVAFLDACGQAIQAAVPFELRELDYRRREHQASLIDERGRVFDISRKHLSTDRQGSYVELRKSLPGFRPMQFTAIIRSLLTGQEQAVTYRPGR